MQEEGKEKAAKKFKTSLAAGKDYNPSNSDIFCLGNQFREMLDVQTVFHDRMGRCSRVGIFPTPHPHSLL